MGQPGVNGGGSGSRLGVSSLKLAWWLPGCFMVGLQTVYTGLGFVTIRQIAGGSRVLPMYEAMRGATLLLCIGGLLLLHFAPLTPAVAFLTIAVSYIPSTLVMLPRVIGNDREPRVVTKWQMVQVSFGMASWLAMSALPALLVKLFASAWHDHCGV